MQPPQQSPSMVPPTQQQLSPQQQQQQHQHVGGNALSFIGRSPPQNGVGQGAENGTTSDDSDDTMPTNSLKRPSSEPSYGEEAHGGAAGMKASAAAAAAAAAVAAAAAAAAAAKKPKVTKKKKKRDPNEPQKPVSAYALFFRDTQAAIKGQNPNASFGEVSKIVASMWDVLATEHKN
uniref:HMG box domain-containing protein n=1 Tax=Anopheles epiroticus TaxID=199890 RepID=A0A182PTG8_9DIPT